MTNKIIIPEEYYVGMKRYKGEIPIAFITPNGDDKAATKRIQTVDSWSKGRGEIDSVVIKNKPIYGYKLTGNIRRGGQYGSGDKWYVEDPRGFQLEITSSNLSYLVQHSIIDNGAILDSCIWARHGSNNVLLATSTELYKAALALTSLSKVCVPIKQVEPGNTVILQNATKGIYLGKYNLLKYCHRDSEALLWHAPQHVIIDYDENNNLNKINAYTNPKVSAVLDNTKLDKKDAEKYINDVISKKQNMINTWWPMLAATSKKPKSMSIHLALVNDINSALTCETDRRYAIELKSGEFGLYTQLDDYEMKHIDTVDFATGHIPYIYNAKNQKYYDKRTISFGKNDVKAVYTIEVVIKSKLGNQISVHL